MNFNSIEPKRLGKSEKGQDSFIKHIFDHVGENNKYYVELGAKDGVDMSNTYYLRESLGWSGLLVDYGYTSNPNINLVQSFITKENICEIFRNKNVPKNFDFLCIDLDGNDYWILQEILKDYKPRVIMVETNVRFNPYESFVIKYDPLWKWDGHKWYGGSPYAFKKLAVNYGYTPVWIHIDDMFLISNDLLTQSEIDMNWLDIFSQPNREIYETHTGGGRFDPIRVMDKSNWIEI